MALTQWQLAEAMGVSRKTVNELCTNRRAVTADTALMLVTVFGNSADFRLNLQQRAELWKALNTPKRRARIEKARPIAVGVMHGDTSAGDHGVKKRRFRAGV